MTSSVLYPLPNITMPAIQCSRDCSPCSGVAARVALLARVNARIRLAKEVQFGGITRLRGVVQLDKYITIQSNF